MQPILESLNLVNAANGDVVNTTANAYPNGIAINIAT